MIPVTTAKVRIERGEPDALGWRPLVRVPGEPHPESAPEGEVLACLWHLSDLHLCDAESPARIAYLDRFADPDSPLAEEVGEVGTYRPQEILTAHVAVTMVETVNRIARGPQTQRYIDAVLVTGDVTDNCQENELDWYRTVISGGPLTPASGGESSTWSGVSDVATWDEHYWHPDGPPPSHEPDRPMRIFGFPAAPGLIEAARQPLTSPGLDYEVLTVYGNHDGLLQGTVPADDALRRLATGSFEITGLAEGPRAPVIARAVAAIGPAAYPDETEAPQRPITPDPRRRLLPPGAFATATGQPGTYWAKDVAGIRVVSLDTVNPHGGWQGSIDEQQLDWLRRELVARPGRPVVVTSHHPSPTMTNDYAPDGSRRVLGDEVVALLLDHPDVVLWVAGHVHFNAAIHHGPDDAGFWEITTSSLIDWPQQGRIIEIVRAGDDIAVISTVVDHHAPIEWSGDIGDHRQLASLSRLLAANDYQRRDPSVLNELRAGAPEVRNVIWWTRRAAATA
jgi:metallophosphoesterase (TIGR03767 family)